jgi:hypothetical protein
MEKKTPRDTKYSQKEITDTVDVNASRKVSKIIQIDTPWLHETHIIVHYVHTCQEGC